MKTDKKHFINNVSSQYYLTLNNIKIIQIKFNTLKLKY